jgi:hypothetical protein
VTSVLVRNCSTELDVKFVSFELEESRFERLHLELMRTKPYLPFSIKKQAIKLLR